MEKIYNYLDQDIGSCKTYTVYTCPDDTKFNDKEDYVEYMLNECDFTIEAHIILDLDDLEAYMDTGDFYRYIKSDPDYTAEYKKFKASDYDDEDLTFEEYVDVYGLDTDKIYDYNHKLADKLDIEIEKVGSRSRGPVYELTGTINNLIAFCEGVCDKLEFDEAGEALVKEKQGLEKLKQRILNIDNK